MKCLKFIYAILCPILTIISVVNVIIWKSILVSAIVPAMVGHIVAMQLIWSFEQ